MSTSCRLLVGVVFASLAGTGCKDLAGTPPLPAGTVSPGITQTAAGAATLAITARFEFQVALTTFIPRAGLLTDELQAYNEGEAPFVGGYGNDADVIVDARDLDQGYDWNHGQAGGPSTDQVYEQLQSVRTSAGQAIGSLAMYAPSTSANTRGELYALTGYAEVMLADLFCSGIPLSTLDYQGNYSYEPGSTTAEVYQHALALFDTALTLAADSAPIVNLAKVGQGRAYLALGQYTAAGQAVSSVPLDFSYDESIMTCVPIQTCVNQNNNNPQTYDQFELGDIAFVSDQEGGTGLPFISSGDPRTASDSVWAEAVPSTDIVNTIYFPHKYRPSGVSELVVASGIEAQLITAEAQLNAGNASGAFATLNALRTGNPVTAGKLPPLVDPGTFSAEVDTLFTERAAWLFVDGHRQGDLRRLVRQYGTTHNVTAVANRYPSGVYPALGSYGRFVDAPIPSTELANPLFRGCLSRD